MLCIRMADAMEKVRHPGAGKRDVNKLQPSILLREARLKLAAALLYLPDTLRERVRSLGAILFNAAEIAYGGMQGNVKVCDLGVKSAPGVLCGRRVRA